MKALLLVDLQNDFMPGGALPVPYADQLAAIANSLLTGFKVVAATQDWHPPNHVSFFPNHKGRAMGDVVEFREGKQLLWPVHCVRNSTGAKLHASLQTNRINRIIQKGTDPDVDSYGAFFDNRHQQATGLGDFLREKGTRKIYVMGVGTDFAIRHTALDARGLGFKVVVIEDACRSFDFVPEATQTALQEMKEAGVQFANAKEVMTASV